MNNQKPKLINNKMLKKLIKKEFNKKSFGQQKYNLFTQFIKNNWYILLIASFIFFVLYLKYHDKNKHVEDFNNNKKQKKIKHTDKHTNKNLLDYQYTQRNGPDLDNNIPKYIF